VYTELSFIINPESAKTVACASVYKALPITGELVTLVVYVVVILQLLVIAEQAA
jgi:hypothetical protein